MDLSGLPLAKKTNAPSGGWESRCAEYVIEGEVNRFRYCLEGGYKLADGPGKGPSGERRVFARLVGKRGEAYAQFEELKSWGYNNQAKRPKGWVNPRLTEWGMSTV